MANQQDARANKEVLREWERLKTIKNDLIKMGLATGDTTPQQCMTILRQQLPPEIFGETAGT